MSVRTGFLRLQRKRAREANLEANQRLYCLTARTHTTRSVNRPFVRYSKHNNYCMNNFRVKLEGRDLTLLFRQHLDSIFCPENCGRRRRHHRREKRTRTPSSSINWQADPQPIYIQHTAIRGIRPNPKGKQKLPSDGPGYLLFYQQKGPCVATEQKISTYITFLITGVGDWS